jgi:hypothetical protein
MKNVVKKPNTVLPNVTSKIQKKVLWCAHQTIVSAVKKPNTVLPNVTSKIQTKSIRPMVCALNNCFCHKKGEINFTQSDFKNMDKQQTPYSSALPAAVIKPVQYWSC